MPYVTCLAVSWPLSCEIKNRGNSQEWEAAGSRFRFCRKSFLNKSKKGNSGAAQTGGAFVVMQTEDHKYDYDLLQPAEERLG
jgi:hypothetical protein